VVRPSKHIPPAVLAAPLLPCMVVEVSTMELVARSRYQETPVSANGAARALRNKGLSPFCSVTFCMLVPGDISEYNATGRQVRT